MAKAFIFSIDAFVAFTLIIVVLHALIFLSAVPSSYYGGLMQANYLARDTLNSLVAANASRVLDNQYYARMSMLDYIVSTNDTEAVRDYVGANIPYEYGYTLEFWNSQGKDWGVIYDTANYRDDPHNKLYNKLRATSHSIFFGYTDVTGRRNPGTPYCYMTCNGDKYGGNCPSECDTPVSLYDAGEAALGLVRLSVYR